MTPEEAGERRILNDAEAAEALAALRSVAEGHAVTSRPHAAAHGVRWSDMHAAVVEAAYEREMAIFGIDRTDRRVQYHLRTIGDRPVLLDIHRRDDERIYDAAATVGRFGDEDAEHALLEALDRHLRAFGEKHMFRDD